MLLLEKAMTKVAINQGYNIEFYQDGYKCLQHIDMGDHEYLLHDIRLDWMWRNVIPYDDFKKIDPHPSVSVPAFCIYAVSDPTERLVLMYHDFRNFIFSKCCMCGYENYGADYPHAKYREFYFCQKCRVNSRKLFARLGFKKITHKKVTARV